MQMLQVAATILIFASFSMLGIPSSISSQVPVSAFVHQTSPQRYVTLFPISGSPNPSPWVLYPGPDNNTVWVAGYATGTPQVSKIWQFFVGNESSRSILTLKNTIVNSIIVDHLRNRVWFAYNSTVGYYSTLYENTTYPFSFPNESPQYLTLDHQGRLWISLAGNFGASEIAMFDDPSGLTTYPIRTANATVH